MTEVMEKKPRIQNAQKREMLMESIGPEGWSMTQRELEAYHQVPFKFFTKTIYAMREAYQVRIESWERNSGAPAPKYRIGSSIDNPDAPEPKSLTTRGWAKRYREKNAAMLRAKRKPKCGMWSGLL